MIRRAKNQKSGFVALITAIIISVILLAVAASLNQKGFFARAEILEAEYKFRSSVLAEACVDRALLKLAEDIGYSMPETLGVVDDACDIVSVSTSGSQITINTSARFPAGINGAVTKLQIVVNLSDLSVISWRETL